MSGHRLMKSGLSNLEIIGKEATMTTSSIINSLGLVLDIIGAMLLLKFGVPNKIDPSGTEYRVTSDVNSAEIEKARVYQRWSNFAILFIILGFLLQLISNFI